MSNFDFLQEEWPEFIDDAKAMERLVRFDARGACVRARFLVEQVVLWMYENDEDLTLPYDTSMANIIHDIGFKKIVGYEVFNKVNAIRKVGNIAVHDRKTINEHDAVNACREVFHIMYWLWNTYTDEERPDLPFDPDKIPRIEPQPAESDEKVRELEEQVETHTEELRRVQRELKEKDEALAQRNREVKQMRLQSKRFADDHDYNEAQTRELLIDVLLRESGWNPAAENVREYEVQGMPTQSGTGYVDYVLWDDDGKPLAAVEAKRTTRNYEEGQQQALLYADCLEKKFSRRPVIFLTNGYETWLWEDQSYPPRPVMGFYQKSSLQRLFYQRAQQQSLKLVKVNEDITGRPYQIEAIRRVAERFESGYRESLLVMATGTGKTRVAISITDVLQRYNRVKRVLFLADRKTLVKQAYKEFGKHLPDTPIVNLLDDKDDKSARVVFSTYPTMLNQIEELEEGRRKFDPGYFDLVIIDEAHRSVYNKYGAIFRYFDSLLLGLTATPKGEVDRNTYELFNSEVGVPTFAYELDDAVIDGYLTPPKKLSVPVKFLQEGISYHDLTEEEQAEYEELFYDDESGELPDHIDAGKLNSWLFNQDTVDQVLKQLMTEGIKVENGDRIGKTIIFAKNHKHAVYIQERFDKNFPQYKGHFARVIDNQVEHSQDLIEKFVEPEKKPVIVISVDMLDTGVDAPDVVNLVFFKPVRSKTKFNQMIGRGTRLREDLYAPGVHKAYFVIFDYCGNFEFFDQHPEGIDSNPAVSMGRQLFDMRLTLSARLADEPYNRDEELQQYRAELLDQLHQAVERLEEQSVMVREHLSLKHKLSERGVWDYLESHERREVVDKFGDIVDMGIEDEEEARRFDLLIATLQHELLDGELTEKKTKNRLVDMAERLHAKRSIPAVKKVLPTINRVLSDEFWQEVTLLELEKVRVALRNLLHLIDWKDRGVLYSNFTDVLGEPVEVGMVNEASFVDKERYERKIKAFIEEHQNHLVIEKIRKAQPLTPQDIQTLEDFLLSADPEVSKEEFYEIVGKDMDLVRFIRSITGLDKQVVRQEFEDYLNDQQLSSTQIAFIRNMIESYSRNGRLTIEELYEEPFNFIDQNGIDGVFSDQPEVIPALLEKVGRLNEVKAG